MMINNLKESLEPGDMIATDDRWFHRGFRSDYDTLWLEFYIHLYNATTRAISKEHRVYLIYLREYKENYVEVYHCKEKTVYRMGNWCVFELVGESGCNN